MDVPTSDLPRDDPGALRDVLAAIAHLLLARTRARAAFVTLTDEDGLTTSAGAGAPELVAALSGVADVVGSGPDALVLDDAATDTRLTPTRVAASVGPVIGAPLAGVSTGLVGAVCVATQPVDPAEPLDPAEVSRPTGPVGASEVLEEVMRVRDVVAGLARPGPAAGALAREQVLVAASPAVVTVVDRDLVVRYVNARGVGHFGAPAASALLGRSLLHLVPEEDADRVLDLYDRVLAGTPYHGPLRHVAGAATEEPRVRLVESACVAITWEGRPAVLSTGLDVSGRVVIDADMAAVARAAQLFSAASIGYLEASLDGHIDDHNPFVARLLQATTLVGRRLSDVVVPADRSVVREMYGELTAGRRDSVEMPVRLRSSTGAAVRCVLSLALVRNILGEPAHVAAVVLDDSARHFAQEQLAERHERSAALLAAIPDAVLICTPAGVVTEVNAQTEHLFGYSRDELVGQHVEVLVPAASRDAHRWHRERYAASTHVRPMITGPGISGVHKDGSLVPVEVNLASVDLPTGPALVASVRDVREARQVESDLRLSHDLMAGILSAATEQAIIATDLEGDIELFSRGAERLLGYRHAEVVGRPASMFDDASPDDFVRIWGLDPAQPANERMGALVSSGVSATRPWAYRTRSGERRDVLLSVTVRSGPDGPAGLIIVATDQTQRLVREAELAGSEERFRLAFEGAPVGVALVSLRDPEPGRFLQVNAAMTAILGYGADELVEASMPTIAHPEDLPLVVANLTTLAESGLGPGLVEHRCIHADGHDVWVQASFAVIHDTAGPDYAVCMLNDITARRRAESELTHNALHDTLTGLPNRALLTEHLLSALARAEHAGAGVGVLYIDLDNFKDVNDSLGHAAGDELLVDVGHRLAGCMRDSDLAARLAGDEFVVVCEDVSSIDDVTAVADRVGRALAIQLPLAGKMVTVSASIGISYAADGDERAEDLLRAADIAMYRAKANGRSRYEFSDPAFQTRALRQIELEADLRVALGVPTDTLTGPAPRAVRRTRSAHAPHDQLFLDYQPCFEAGTGRLVACEALLRWNHPTAGLLGPGQFLDVAEDRALMIPLGAWVLREACTQAARWAEQLGADAPEMWVNVSAAQIGRDRFVTRVADTLDATGLPARLLCLELTERQALSSAHATLDDLNALPELGVRLSIDDFGTGYAGLDYLRRLPVSSLKVDASYVAAIGQDRTGTALAATVVNLGHALDLTVVAEGVETVEQRDAVVQLGADVLQGFLLARPGPASAVDELLARAAATRVLAADAAEARAVRPVDGRR